MIEAHTINHFQDSKLSTSFRKNAEAVNRAQ